MRKIEASDNSDVLEGIRSGDEEAFRLVYDTYWDRLYVSAYNVLRDRYRSEDVVQEVFSHLWNNAHELEIGNLKA